METLWRGTDVLYTRERNTLIPAQVWPLPTRCCFFFPTQCKLWSSAGRFWKQAGAVPQPVAISDVPAYCIATCLFRRGLNALGKSPLTTLNTGLSLKVLKPCAIQLKKTRACIMKCVTSMHTIWTCKGCYRHSALIAETFSLLGKVVSFITLIATSGRIVWFHICKGSLITLTVNSGIFTKKTIKYISWWDRVCRKGSPWRRWDIFNTQVPEQPSKFSLNMLLLGD